MNQEINKNLTVIIVTFNEEKLISRAIESVAKLNVETIIFDSFSSDRTKEIAESFGCKVIQDYWENWTVKINSAISSKLIKTPWVMRVDADEFLTDELISELKSESFFDVDNEVVGFNIYRRIHFLGKWIRHGDMYQKCTRIFRYQHVKYEERILDEHVATNGKILQTRGDLVDSQDKGLSFWLKKHIRNAQIECYVDWNNTNQKDSWKNHHGMMKLRRFLKEEIYSRIPFFIRPPMYWFYRYFIRLGFLDGIQGLIFHFLHAFWYRLIIDAMIFEAKKEKGATLINLEDISG